MAFDKNARPQGYSPSKALVARYLVRLLMPNIIGTERVHIDYEDAASVQDFEKFQFILAPPALWGVLKILFSPTFQPGETFQKGEWYLKKGDLHKFVEILFENKTRLFFKYFILLSNLKGISFFIKQKIIIKYFTRQVKLHYDIDSDLYASFLDREMVYTCGFFEKPTDDLFTAQMKKLDTVISRMKLPPEKATVLEIGCGWGSLARRIVSSHPNVQYVGLTIAGEQIKRADQIDTSNLTAEQKKRIRYLEEDYLEHAPSDISGYDGISVIGMMEHVGLGHYGIFLQKICSLLKHGGRAVIHTIISGSSAEPTNDWIDRHIFHGGYAPSLAEITYAAEGCKCKIEAVFVYDPDNYRITIEKWISNFLANWDFYRRNHIKEWDDARADKLFRIWYFYLSSVRNMFLPSVMEFQVAHVVVKKA